MTRQAFVTKWLLYGLALLPVWWLEVYVLNRFPVFGVIPVLLPVAAVTVAVLEGAVAGAGFGLTVGILCDAVYLGRGGWILALALLCAASGAAAQYVLRRNFGGCLLCSALALGLIGMGRVLMALVTGLAPLGDLLSVAAAELLWSLCFVVLICPWLTWVSRRITKGLRL